MPVDEQHYNPNYTGEKNAFFGLPTEVKFCKSCVISNQRPNSSVEFKHIHSSKKETINFNEDGICDACRMAERKSGKIDWKQRETELKDLLNKYRKNDGSFDCLVPGSGGKDSVYAALKLKYEYGMNPLTVTWAPHIYTDIGWKNFQSWLHSGFDNYLFHPNGKIHRLLTKYSFTNLLHPFQPFIFGQKNYAPKMALKFDIPLVFYGENEAEYGNPIAENSESRRDLKYFSTTDVDLDSIYLGGRCARQLLDEDGLKMSDLEQYLPADANKLEDANIDVRYLGYYLKWDPQEAYYYSVEHANFKANQERTEGTYSKYNSLDDRIDGFHYYTTHVKFGLGRTSYDAAQEIRNNKITREEGVALVQRYDGEFPKRYFKEILEYMSLEEDEFFEIVDRFRSPHLWMKSGSEWSLRHTVSNLDAAE